MGIDVRRMESLDELQTIDLASNKLPGMITLKLLLTSLQVHDISLATAYAKKHTTEDHRIIVAVDNTFLGPINQRR